MSKQLLRVLPLLMVPGLAGAGSFTPLGALPGGTNSYAGGVSADDAVVVGFSLGTVTQGYRWTSGGGDDRHKTIACRIDRARAELGYEPKIDLRGDMRRSVEWMVDQGIQL